MVDFPRLEPGCVWLVGVDPGGQGFMPVLALQALQQADFIIFDSGVDPALLALIPASCMAQLAPAKAGKDGARAAARYCIELAMRGWRVVRLKAGDPFSVPEDVAEAELLAEAQVGLRILPEIDAAHSLRHRMAIGAGASRRTPREHPTGFTMSGMG